MEKFNIADEAYLFLKDEIRIIKVIVREVRSTKIPVREPSNAQGISSEYIEHFEYKFYSDNYNHFKDANCSFKQEDDLDKNYLISKTLKIIKEKIRIKLEDVS
jgi:hypothetical protein